MSLWFVILQAAVAAAPVPPAADSPIGRPMPPRFSILVDAVPSCPKDPDPNGEIIVCARSNQEQKLPFPNKITPDHPVPVNPDMTGRGALAGEATPCAARQGGCTVGFDFLGVGTSLVRLAQKAIAPDSCCERPGEGTSTGLLVTDVFHGVKHAFAKKPDKSKRVSIPLDEPVHMGQVLP
jgi:hypothetical protein